MSKIEFISYIIILCQIFCALLILKKNLFKALLFWPKFTLFRALSSFPKHYFILCIIILFQILIYSVHFCLVSNSNLFRAFIFFLNSYLFLHFILCQIRIYSVFYYLSNFKSIPCTIISSLLLPCLVR